MLLYPKIYNRVNVFGIKNKIDFDFVFSTSKTKQNGSISPKIINELPAPANQLLVTQMLCKAKNPKDCQKRTVVNEFEQAPLVKLNTAKRRAEEKVELERRLSENTAKMAIIKKPKIA